MSAIIIQESSASMQMSRISIDLEGSSDSDLETDSRMILPLSMLSLDSQRAPMDTHYLSEFG